MPEVKVFFQDIENDNNIDPIDFLLKGGSSISNLIDDIKEDISNHEENIVKKNIYLNKLNKALEILEHDIDTIKAQRSG